MGVICGRSFRRTGGPVVMDVAAIDLWCSVGDDCRWSDTYAESAVADSRRMDEEELEQKSLDIR